MSKPAILLIGGLDPQGCAGLSVDIQTVQHHGAHPIPLVTCLTEQTQLGLTTMGALTAEKFMGQYHSCVADFDISAIKIGLIPNIEIAQCIGRILDNHAVPIVLDPVLTATSGGIAAGFKLIDFIRESLLKKITLLTPNLPELAILSDSSIESLEQADIAMHWFITNGLNACLVKGGHAESEWATDYFINLHSEFFCYHAKINKQVRGTGCVLASSITTHLAFGLDMRDAVVLAKAYLSRGIRLAEVIGPYQVLHHSSSDMELIDFPKLCYDYDLVGAMFHFPSCPDRLGIYPVVENEQWISRLLAEGITTIQLRMKKVDAKERIRQINAAVEHSKAYENSAFFVNDYWQDAIDAGAYGAHLGQEDLDDAKLIEIERAGLRLGISTHSYWELARALAVNPSYIALGPIFETTSKQMPFSPQGIKRLQLWIRLLEKHYPLVAIGGIDLHRAEQLHQTGVGSVAMISAITQAEDYQQTTRALLAVWQ